MRITKVLLLFLAAGLVLAGCAYRPESGRSVANPIDRKLSWFSYLDAGDIRRDCAQGIGEGRYRLVYNGQYDRQIRAYELYPAPDGGATLVVRVKGEDNLAEWWLRRPSDILAPWSMRESRTTLSPGELSELKSALRASGFGDPAPAGLRLHSQKFYWIAAGCRDGGFHYYAWQANGDSTATTGLQRVRFADFLLRHDTTGLAFRPPQAVSYAGLSGHGGHDHDYRGYFTLTVGEHGLSGVPGSQ